MTITLDPTGYLRFTVLGAAYRRMFCLLLVGTGCSWGVDLDNLAERSHAPDASARPDASRDQVSADRVERDSFSVSADLPVFSDGSPDSMSDTRIDSTLDSAVNSPSGPDSLAEDAAVQGDEGREVAADAPTDNMVDDGIVGTNQDTKNAPGDLASDPLPHDPAVACSRLPPVNATMILSTVAPVVTACGYTASTLPLIHAAVDASTFAASAACGMCILVQTAAATVEAMVVDLGPPPLADNPTSISLSKSGMDLLVPDGSTYVTKGVQWTVTTCSLGNSGMSFTFQSGSNAYYAALLVQNHRYGLSKVEYKNGTTYKSLLRMPYNLWVAPEGMGNGPFTLRMTDQLGQTVEQSGIPLQPDTIFNGESQFPLCSDLRRRRAPRRRSLKALRGGRHSSAER